MSRVPALKPENLTPDQQRVFAAIAGTRKRGVGGPFAIWLRNPAVAEPANGLGNALRVSGKLDKRLFELMVLVVARHWSAQYEWSVHESAAANAGLSTDIIAAIRARQRPDFLLEDERLIFELVTELNETKRISVTTYDRALQTFGLDLMIELISAAGFYTMVAMMLNAFEVETPDGSTPLR